MKIDYCFESHEEIPTNSSYSHDEVVCGVYVVDGERLSRHDFLCIMEELRKKKKHKTKLVKADFTSISSGNILFLDLNVNSNKVQESSEIIVVDEKVQQDGKTIIKFRTINPFERGEAVRHEDYSTHFSISSKEKRSFFSASPFTKLRYISDYILLDVLGKPAKALPVLI